MAPKRKSCLEKQTVKLDSLLRRPGLVRVAAKMGPRWPQKGPNRAQGHRFLRHPSGEILSEPQGVWDVWGVGGVPQ